MKSQLEMDRMLKAQGHGLSLPRLRLLGFIAEKGQTRSVDVAEAFGFAPRTVTEALDGLEKAGLIGRTASATDRRAKLIALTDAGRAALDASEPAVKRFVDQVFTALDASEKSALAGLLTKLTDRLDTLAAEREPA
ncbi:MarR family transcriptional regulator [Sphingomonas sp. AP4-R1]|uniref:MarR family winged helix-turn-helix transcriptional regulator n=1 Tax=Sphingomonas sp. AP4-R1 TaxID=2735134 RepID=UPI001493A0A8|nr:MarR family transcriptional regulator [Sphingomonas sp. AP4-R1]QJU58746.1 MarR family transcriptional regulator [Sphingomonas sp. AP4-R1]